MTLKEKLAKEYSENVYSSQTRLSERSAAYLDFIAGFEKAREMALHTVKESSFEIDTDDFYTESRFLVKKIKNLGEEEV